jgi:hypothetical protein
MESEKVRLIFKETYGLYKLYLNEELFRAITENITKAPQELVPGIMADTYNFYTKWSSIQGDIDITQMWSEAKEINRKYNDCDLSRNIMLAISNIIEQEFKPGR